MELLKAWPAILPDKSDLICDIGSIASKIDTAVCVFPVSEKRGIERGAFSPLLSF